MLSDIILQRQELLDKLYPKNIQQIVEAQKLVNKITRSIPLATPILDNKAIGAYTKVLKRIETVITAYPTPKIVEAVAKYYSLASAHYNLEDLLFDETESPKPIVRDESRRIKRIIQEVYHNNSKLVTIEPRHFEEMVAELLYKQGFQIELTKQTRDNGYDILAIMSLDRHNPLKFLVECKRFVKQKVDVNIVRSFKEVIDTEKANRGIIVTTSYFTRDALKKQKETPYLLDFRDKNDVIEWVNDYYNSERKA